MNAPARRWWIAACAITVAGIAGTAMFLWPPHGWQRVPAVVDATGDAPHNLGTPQEGRPPLVKAVPLTGKELYSQHCAACHGDLGDGLGKATALLFPRPRDFRAGRFRLVSTENMVPSSADIHAVLVRGMPGSAMPPWGHLPKRDLDALVSEVLRLRREGLRDRLIQLLREDEEEIDEAEVDEQVIAATTPGDVGDVVTIVESPESAARGKELYLKQGCHSCHGNEGRGDGQQSMVDVEGLPTRPRDFTGGIFKGGHDPVSLFHRVRLGMPGTPMPSSSNLTAEQIGDMVSFVRSLSTEELRQQVVLKRGEIKAKRLPAIALDARSDTWTLVPSNRVQLTPTWWRDHADPQLVVQAAHDDKTLVVRLTWSDTTKDLQSTRSEAFKDAAAIQLFRGPIEPFLGMGDARHPVHLWLWDADRQNRPDLVEGQYPNTAVDIYPFAERQSDSPEFARIGASMANQPDISLPARAVGNQVTPPGKSHGGSTLAGAGPGTVTFRPPRDQSVTAKGDWEADRWTVVFSRPLTVPGEAQLNLHGGDRVSAAFAIWDGSHQDRNGQKSFSIWQDLVIER